MRGVLSHFSRPFQRGLFCQAAGARLCTAAELLDGCTAGTGCQLDFELVWSVPPASAAATPDLTAANIALAALALAIATLTQPATAVALAAAALTAVRASRHSVGRLVEVPLHGSARHRGKRSLH